MISKSSGNSESSLSFFVGHPDHSTNFTLGTLLTKLWNIAFICTIASNGVSSLSIFFSFPGIDSIIDRRCVRYFVLIQLLAVISSERLIYREQSCRFLHTWNVVVDVFLVTEVSDELLAFSLYVGFWDVEDGDSSLISSWSTWEWHGGWS